RTTGEGSTATLVDSSLKDAVKEGLVGRKVLILSGNAASQVRTISDFTASTGALTFGSGFSASIAAGVRYEVLNTLLLTVDGEAPRLVAAKTGVWWDASRLPPPGDTRLRTAPDARADALRLTFEDRSGLLETSVFPYSFVVNGVRPVAALVVDVAGENQDPPDRRLPLDIFLTLPGKLASDNRPTVLVVADLRDKAGNFVSMSQTIRAQDGIPPSLSVSFDRQVGNQEVQITLTTDEVLAQSPTVEVRTLKNAVTGVLGPTTISHKLTQTAPLSYLLSVKRGALDMTGPGSRLNLWVQASDVANPGNASTLGNPTNGASEKAVSFELDWWLNNGLPPRVIASNLLLSSTGLAEEQEIDWTAPLVVTIDFAVGCELVAGKTVCAKLGEGGEYPGDSHTTVQLKSYQVQRQLADGSTEVVAASLERKDNWRFVITVAQPKPGLHTLTIAAVDEAGNQGLRNPDALEPQKLTYLFTVKTAATVAWSLSRGWNLVSLPFVLDNPGVNNLIPRDQPVSEIVGWDATREVWLISRRNPTTNLLEGDITILRADTAYFVKASDAATLTLPYPTVEAAPAGPPLLPSVQVKKGWNLVPVVSLTRPLPSGIPVDEYLVTLGKDWVKLVGFDAATQQWSVLTREETPTTVTLRSRVINTTPEPDVEVSAASLPFVDMCGESHQPPAEVAKAGATAADAVVTSVKVNRVCVGKGYWLYALEAGSIGP
ncbi:MAG: hypothetical protein HYY31_03765, partial [Chloroflexi bacterium]|nr:hypothetical protein [Chloroflexota bacterium]